MAERAPGPVQESDEPHASAWAIRYASQPTPVMEPTQPGEVRVDLLTDPWSVWCWGFEPVRRTLALRYPAVRFRAVVGGMFPRLPRPEEAGFDVERFFAVVQRTTGMPITAEGLLRDRPDSTYPACVHVHAVRLLAPEREGAYLRALREAAYLDGLNISRPAVAAEVAAGLGIDAQQFAEALRSGEPEREFRERLASLHALNLHAYPTLLVTSGQRTARVEGFQSMPIVLGIAEQLSGRRHEPAPSPPVEQVVPEGERVCTREAAEVWGMGVEEAFERLSEARELGVLRHQRLPGGDLWQRA